VLGERHARGNDRGDATLAAGSLGPPLGRPNYPNPTHEKNECLIEIALFDLRQDVGHSSSCRDRPIRKGNVEVSVGNVQTQPDLFQVVTALAFRRRRFA